MAMSVLSIDLVAKLAKYEADMGKAARASEKFASQLTNAFGLAKSAVGVLSAGLGAAGLVALTKSTIDSLDALNDLKDATGASIENISALEDVALRTGTSFDAVGTSLVKFNATLKDAKPGSDAAKAFEAIGLSVTNLKALDPAEALRQTAVALARFADDGNKARLTQELFGKSLREVAPFLKDLAEQGSLVAKVTTKQAEEAERYNKQLMAMEKNARDLTRTILTGLLPAMNRMLSNTTQLSNAGLLGTVVKDAALDMVGMGRLSGDPGADINKLMRERAELQERINKDRFKGVPGLQNESLVGDLAEVNRLLAVSRIRQVSRIDTSGEFSDAVSRRFLGDGNKPSLVYGGAADKAAASKARAEIDFTNKAVGNYIDSLDRQLQKTQDLSAVEEAHIELTKRGAGATLEEVAAIYAKARAIDQARADEERIALKRGLVVEGGVDNSAYQARLKALTDSTESQVFKSQQEDLEFLKVALEKGRIGVDGYSEAVRKLFGITDGHMEKSKSLADDLGLSFSSAFEDAVVGGKKLSDVLKGLQQDIIRIVMRDQVTKPLADSIGKMFKGDGGSGGNLLSNIGSALGKLLGFEGGGFTGAGARIGGLDGRGGMLAMVHPNETVIDHTRGQRVGGQVINITVNPPAGMSRQTGQQLGTDIARQLRIAEGRNG